MKTLATLLVAAAAVTVPVLSFAQSANQGLTRAQVRAELVQLEQSGSNPYAAGDAQYPAAFQVAEANVAAEQGAANPASAANAAQAADSVGGMSEYGRTDSGKPVTHAKPAQQCVGPVSFCNIYFGS
ncbi:DUF4148 domain-containing protein [Paraburkholderia solisilvae]|uniref:DUF4148 domain-containing protein n=1 Tax=Paraburkholderia solisilvae TaxID=624376 RepID=A0A6J5CYS8_9BURK|nr:DUF4148 domain-containing protein [Paraburkholderia solisilvae]CAB3746271.1 hypothetical protein LMG29739_00143 [Paraburkholderia solisilvae]